VEIDDGAAFARLLLGAVDAMVGEVRDELIAAGHPGLTVANELAMQAVDGGVDSAADLARELGVTRQAAAKTIATLESLGYVERAADADDARRKRLTVSARGRDAVAIGAAAFDAAYRRWRDDVGHDAADATAEALRRLAVGRRD
jgi:DNA-binding MarR family transcriptional regulator